MADFKGPSKADGESNIGDDVGATTEVIVLEGDTLTLT